MPSEMKIKVHRPSRISDLSVTFSWTPTASPTDMDSSKEWLANALHHCKNRMVSDPWVAQILDRVCFLILHSHPESTAIEGVFREHFIHAECRQLCRHMTTIKTVKTPVMGMTMDNHSGTVCKRPHSFFSCGVDITTKESWFDRQSVCTCCCIDRVLPASWVNSVISRTPLAKRTWVSGPADIVDNAAGQLR